MAYTYNGARPYTASPGYTAARKHLQSAFAPPGAGSSPPPGAAPQASRPPAMTPGMAPSAMGGAPPRPAAVTGGVSGYNPGAPPPPMGGDVMGSRGGYDPRAGGGQQGRGTGYDRDPISEENPYGKFQIRNPKQWGKYINRLNLREFYKANGPLWEQMNSLLNEANTDNFSDEKRAQFVAPYMEAIDQQYDTQNARLQQDAHNRGITDSTFSEARQGALAGSAANARSQAIHNLFQSEDAAQDENRDKAMSALGGIQGRGIGSAQQGWTSQQQMQMQRILAALQQQQGGGWGDMLGGIGQLAGVAGGLGWRPFS